MKKHSTWDAIENCANDESRNIWSFIDENGNDVGIRTLEKKQVTGYLFLGYWHHFPLEFDIHRYEIWKITWALGTWVKENIYAKDLK